MIMMRPSPPPTAAMSKPPPPVPPRPSKSLVAEALARTRRAAPPPPVCKSQSAASVAQAARAGFARSISEEVKCSSRTLIFQSPRIVRSPQPQPAATPASLSSEERRRSDDDDDVFVEEGADDRNHVNTLIDEMFASVLEVSDEEAGRVAEGAPPEAEAAPAVASTVVIVEDGGKRVQFASDRLNHELLVTELDSMRIEDEKILRRQRKPSKDIFDGNSGGDSEVAKIQHSDWVEMSDGQEVRLSSCQITIDEDEKIVNEDAQIEEEDNNRKNVIKLDYERIKAMSSIHGLPPLPKSLSGFNLLDGHAKPPTPVRTSSMRSGQVPALGHLVYPPHPKANGTNDSPNATGRKTTNLDQQLAILRREMYSLRQQDLSLLSQLWSLNESIQDFRQILQDQEDRVLLPPSPSPTPSSGDEGDGDEFYMSASSMNFRTPPPPVPVRRPSSSSNASSLG